MPDSTLHSSAGAEGQQLWQHRAQSPQRQMANALVLVVWSLANALGKCQLVVDRGQIENDERK